MLKQGILALVLLLSTASTAIAEEKGTAEEKAKDISKPKDSVFGEDGSYNVSVDGAGVKVHGEFDKDGKPISGKGEAGEQKIEAVGRDFHEQRKAERRERKAKMREEKKKAKESRR